MSEFNLIPDEYYAGIRRRRLTLLCASAAIVLVVLAGGSLAVANHVLAQREAELQVLRQQQALSVQQQQRLTLLQQQKQKYESDLRMLSSLQSGVSIIKVVEAVQVAAEASGVQFESWSYLRAGIRAGDDAQARPPSFYAMAAAEQGFPATWESLAHMAIEGRARDHAALSAFVQRLFEHPDVEDVRIARSSRTERGVEFHLAVMVATKAVTT
jgi:hypothetical protein